MAERVGQHGDCGCDHHTGFYDNGFDNGYNHGFDSYGHCTPASYASYARPFAPAACALISSNPDLSCPWRPPTTHTAPYSREVAGVGQPATCRGRGW